MTNINATVLSFQPMVSRGNPHAVLFPVGMIDFQFDTVFQLNIQAVTQYQQLEHLFQAVYMDASQVTVGNTVLTVFATNHQVRIRPGHQGFFPLICNPGSLVFTFTNNDAMNTYGNSNPFSAILLNIPVVASQWQTTDMV